MKLVIYLVCFFLLFSNTVFAQETLKELSMAKFLPKNILVLLTAKNPAELLNKIGRQELTQKYERYYKEIVSEIQKAYGHNLLDPDALRAIGINPTKPLGFCMLEERPEVLTFFFSIKDRSLLLNTINTLANGFGVPLMSQKFEEALILHIPGETNSAFVLKDDVAFIYTNNDRSRNSGLGNIKKLLQLTPETSLAGNGDYIKAARKMGPTSDLSGYINISSFAREVFIDFERDLNEPFENYALKELEKMDASGNASPEEIKRLEQGARKEEEWFIRNKKRKMREFKLLKKLVGGLHSFSFSAGVGQTSLDAKAFLSLSKDSIWKTFLKGGSSTSTLTKALVKRPLALLDGRLDPKAALELIELIALAEGNDLSEVRTILKQEFGLDLEQDIIEVLAGDIGVALTGDIDLSRLEESFRDLNVSAYLKFKDAEKGKALLNSVATHPKIKVMLQENIVKNGVSFQIPGWKFLHFVMNQEDLIITTDSEFVNRVFAGNSASFLSTTTNERMKNLLEKEVPTPAFLGILDSQAFFSLIAGFSPSYGMGSSKVGGIAKVETSSDDNVPFSKEYKAKEKEIEVIGIEIENKNLEIKKLQEIRNELYRQREEEEIKSLFEVAKRFGSFILVAQTDTDGISLQASLFVNDESIPAFVSHVIEDIMAVEEKKRIRRQKLEELWSKENNIRNQIEDLYNKKSQLENELYDIRQNDIEKYRAANPKSRPTKK